MIRDILHGFGLLKKTLGCGFAGIWIAPVVIDHDKNRAFKAIYKKKVLYMGVARQTTVFLYIWIKFVAFLLTFFASCMTRLWFTYLINGRSGGVVLEVCTKLRTLILSFQSTYLGHALFSLALATFKANVKISRTRKREHTSRSKGKRQGAR